MYYLRTKGAAKPIQFTVDKSKLAQNASTNDSSSSIDKPKKKENMKALTCSLDNKDECLMCGS